MDGQVIRDNLKSVGVIREGTTVTMVGIRSENINALFLQCQQVGISWGGCGEVGLSGDGLQCGLGQSGSDERSSDVGGVRQSVVAGVEWNLALGASGLDLSGSGDRSGPWVSQAVGSGAKSVWVSAISVGPHAVTVGGVEGFDFNVGLSVLVQVDALVLEVIFELFGGDDSDNLALLAAFGDDGAGLPLQVEQGSFSGSDFGSVLDWLRTLEVGNRSNWEIVGEDAESASIGGVRDADLLAFWVDVSVRADLVAKSITVVVGSLSGVSEAISSLSQGVLRVVLAAEVTRVVAAVRVPLGRGASQKERKDLPNNAINQ